MQDGLEEKIDRLTVMMDKLTTNDDGTNKQFKPQMYQSRRRGQARDFYNKCSYNQRIGLDQILETGEFSMDEITEVDHGMNKIIGMTLEELILEVTRKHIKIRILGDRIVEVDIEEIF